jgi:hypothetical protein
MAGQKEINMKNEFEDRKHLDEICRKYFELREKQNGFSGISFQLSKIEESMLTDFERSTSIKHPGDKGNSRENFLRKFLSEYGYLPKKYGVSSGSSHVISSTGHRSSQIDLLIYDALDCPKLMTLEDIQFFPIESVYGIIEVKSDLNSRDTLFDSLEKIASYKRIPVSQVSEKNIGSIRMVSPATHGFGIIFAYDASLKWKTLFEFVEEFEKNHPKREWPNLICILNQGLIIQLNNRKSVYNSDEIEESGEGTLMGSPAGYGNLLNFYLILMEILNKTTLPSVKIANYVSIDNPVNEKSYTFAWGELAEMGRCDIHGEYLKKISPEKINMILDECRDKESINWIKATDIAYGNELDEEKYKKQPRSVKIYNPENRALSEIIIDKEDLHRGLLFEDIVIQGEEYWLPYYYVIKDDLIKYCPECKND